MRLRLTASASNRNTLSGNRNGRSPCAYSMNAAPMLCVTLGDRTPIQREPDEPFDELMNGEERRERCEEEFTPVLHSGQCYNPDRSQHPAASKVRSC